MKLFSVIYTITRCPFGGIFTEFKTVTKPEDIDSNGVLLLHGGADISPSIYNEVPKWTQATKEPSERDKKEIELFNWAVKNEMPIIGICRGHQLAACLSGHSLWQHVNGHLCSHRIQTHDNFTLYASADHHQAVRLNQNEPAIVLAWDDLVTQAKNQESQQELDKIIEAVYYPNTDCIGFQPHPEWMNSTEPFVQWCGEQIKHFLLEK